MPKSNSREATLNRAASGKLSCLQKEMVRLLNHCGGWWDAVAVYKLIETHTPQKPSFLNVKARLSELASAGVINRMVAPGNHFKYLYSVRW